MRFHRSLQAIAAITLSMPLAAQQFENDSARIWKLTHDAAATASRALPDDESARTTVYKATMALVGLGDIDAALQTASLLARDSRFRTTYRGLSRDIVCYLLEDRKIPAAAHASQTLAAVDPFGGDWTTAHLAASLLNLPRPLRPSLRNSPVDTSSLIARAITIASDVRDPEAATDLYITLSSSFQRRNSARAQAAIRSADSVRKLIRDADRFTSRRAIVAAQAAAAADWSLASIIADSLSDRRDIQFVIGSLERTRERAASGTQQIDTVLAKLRQRFATLKPQRDGRQPLTNEIEAEGDTIDPAISKAVEALRRGDLKRVDKALDAIRDPLNLGLKAVALRQLADSAPTPELSAEMRRKSVAMLMSNRRYALRDELLSEFALETLVNGHNEEAIDIVNTIHDERIARRTLSDIGQSTMANLDPPKLRKLVDRIKVRAVKDQVLYRLMISMLLSQQGPQENNRWGIALVDSIHTPELKAKAKVAVARFLFFRHDSVASRRLFLQVLTRDLDKLDQYERSTVVNLLSALRADRELLDWAMAMPESKRKAEALLSLAGQLALRLPHSADGRAFVVSNGGDECRERF